ncbi:MAG: polyprenyl diphosphate synthase [archaeon]
MTSSLKHLGIILDGNRRFAKKNKLNPLTGHEHGVKVVWDFFEWAKELGIKEVTMYAFSTENFKRSKIEVNYLLKLFFTEFDKLLASGRLENDKIKVNFVGRLNLFDKKLQNKMKEMMEQTKNYKGITANFCMAYGGRAEIVDSVNNLIKKGVKKVDENMISKNLSLQSSPDLIIRTSEQRLSNFLLWQCAYSEIMFLPKMLWPEFTKKDLIKCIGNFNSRQRRFGK